MAQGHHKGTGTYIVVALILAVITYIEYWIVEFPPSWMDPFWILVAVVVMSVAKFWMVIWYFMHLKDDPKIYTGFFTSGMVIGLGTFVALMAMFLLPRAVAPVMAGAEPTVPQAAVSPPRDGALTVTPPAAPADGFAVRDDEDEGGDAAPAPVAAFDVALGASTYANCVGCHQPTGAGIPGAFPPLAGNVADLYLAGGREYLVNVVLYGLAGPIEVAGMRYDGMMPGFANLSDEAIAAVLNHTLSEWGNAEAIGEIQYIQAGDVAGQRGQGRSAADVLQLRPDLSAPTGAVEPEPEPVAEPAVADESADEPADAADAADAEDAADAAEPEAADAPTVDTPAADPTFDVALGESTYANCVSCHQPTGAGIPGAFPPLAGHVADLFNADGGRQYLIEVMLYGVQGAITVGGTTYNGFMPGWQQLNDEAIAAVINHSLTSWGNADLIDDFDAIRADEVAAERGRGLSAGDVYQRRGALGLD